MCIPDKRDQKSVVYFDGLEPHKRLSAQDAEKELGPPLGETLLDLVVNYLFFPGFAIPRRLRSDGTFDSEVIVKVWQTGIGSNKSLNCTKDNEKNQMETLRLLIALTSRPLYIQSSKLTFVILCSDDVLLKRETRCCCDARQ